MDPIVFVFLGDVSADIDGFVILLDGRTPVRRILLVGKIRRAHVLQDSASFRCGFEGCLKDVAHKEAMVLAVHLFVRGIDLNVTKMKQVSDTKMDSSSISKEPCVANSLTAALEDGNL